MTPAFTSPACLRRVALAKLLVKGVVPFYFQLPRHSAGSCSLALQ